MSKLPCTPISRTTSRTTPPLALLLLWSLPVQAATPVVYDGGDAEDLTSLVSDRTGLPQDQLEAIPLFSLLDEPAQVVGDAVMRRCVGEVSRMEVVRADLVRAEAAWQKRDRLTAFDHLDLAVARLGCLAELVEPKIAARVFMLRGGLEAEKGNADAARGEFRTALSFDSDLAWSSAFPVEGQVFLAEERETPNHLTIKVMPTGTTSGPWIDGKVVSESSAQIGISAGLHLAQHPSAAGIRSAWVVVGGDTALVLPGSFRRPILELIADPATRQPVEALLAATLPDFQAAYISQSGGLWLLTRIDVEGADIVDTTVLVEPPPPPPPEPDKGKRDRKGRKGDKGDKKD